eukprot:12916134-Prorocentrum_lima.AAC.1
MTWKEDMPAGLLELEAATQRYQIWAVVCYPETQQIIWVGQPYRQQVALYIGSNTGASFLYDWRTRATEPLTLWRGRC